MAGLDKLKSGKWRARVRRKGWPETSATFTTKTAARRWITQTEAAMDKGQWTDGTQARTTTLGDVLDLYLEKKIPRLKGHQPRYEVEKWKKEKLAEKAIGLITKKDISDWMEDRGEVVSAKTVTNEIARLSSVYTFAITELHMDGLAQIVQAVKKPYLDPDETERDRRLEPGEYERLMEAADADPSPWIKPLIIVAIETAARRGELVKVKWTDIDLKARTARFRKTITKNGRQRVPGLSTLAAATLASLPRSIKGRVFPLHHDTVTALFTRVCEAAGIEDLRFHDLRHEATSRLFEKGLTTEEVKAQTGHKSYKSLERYTHLQPIRYLDKLG